MQFAVLLPFFSIYVITSLYPFLSTYSYLLAALLFSPSFDIISLLYGILVSISRDLNILVYIIKLWLIKFVAAWNEITLTLPKLLFFFYKHVPVSFHLVNTCIVNKGDTSGTCTAFLLFI